MKKILFIFCLLVTISIFSQEEKRLALVIGNSNYDSIAKLANPVNDAKLIARTLDSLDFEVILATDLDKGEFMSKVVEFGKKRADYDVGFVYYAGHGVQINGENYLLPTNQNFDEEWKVEEYAINVNRIMKYLTALTDQVNILILDACRNNPWEGNFRSVGGSKNGGLAKIPAPTGSLIAFSTDAGAVAADGDGENSIYCKSLVKNMVLENTSLDQVFRNVRTDVLKESKDMQRPIESSQLTGQAFYLVKSNYEKEFSFVESLFVWNPYFDEADKTEDLYLALEKLNKIIAVDEINTRALYWISNVYLELKQIDKSLQKINELINIDPNDASAYRHRSRLYGILYKDDLAVEDNLKAMEIDPEHIGTYYSLIANYRGSEDLNNLKEGIELIDKFLKTHPNDEEFYRQKGNLYREIGVIYQKQKVSADLINENNKLAIDAYDKAINLDPKNGFYIFQKGEFLSTIGDHEGALKMFQMANDLKPDEPSPIYEMLYTHFTINKLDPIIELCEKLIALDFDDPVPYYLLSKYYSFTNDYVTAATYMSISIFKYIEDKKSGEYPYEFPDYLGRYNENYIFLDKLYLERFNIYKSLNIDILACRDLNNTLNHLQSLTIMTDKELDNKYMGRTRVNKSIADTQKLILENCGS